ncbi:MAG: hypothetical protein ACI4SG_04165 [Oligosphaeraceae bacterium]
MPTLKEFNARHRRESLSLFEDESRSNCTVEEAKAYEKSLSQSRRRRALLVAIPLVVILGGGGIFWHCHSQAAAREAARQEEEQAKRQARQEIVEGLPSARMEIRIQGVSGDSTPGQVTFVAQQALWQKPSEVRVVKIYSGMHEPIPFSMSVNGETSLPVVNEEGRELELNLADNRVDPDLLAAAVCQAWNRLYPEAQHPMEIKIPQTEESPAQKSEKQRLERFQKIPQLDDPRMVNPSDH